MKIGFFLNYIFPGGAIWFGKKNKCEFPFHLIKHGVTVNHCRMCGAEFGGCTGKQTESEKYDTRG